MKLFTKIVIIGFCILFCNNVFSANSAKFQPIKILAGENGKLTIKLNPNWGIVAVGLSNCTAQGPITVGENVINHRKSINKKDNIAVIYIENSSNEKQSFIKAAATGYWIQFGEFSFNQNPVTKKWYLVIQGWHGPQEVNAKISGSFMGAGATTRGIGWKDVRSLERTQKNWIRSIDRTGGIYKAKIVDFKKANAEKTFSLPW